MAYNGRKPDNSMDTRLLRAKWQKTHYNGSDNHDGDAENNKPSHKKKPLLVRMYDTIIPSRHGGYTEEQDYRHSAISFVVVFTLVVTIITSVCLLINNHNSYRTDHILVPAVTFTSDQASDVTQSLIDTGFVDVSYVKDKGVYAYGTKEMCDEWRASFKEKNVDDAMSKMDESFIASGIVGMSVSDDSKTFTIKTLTTDSSVDVIGYIVTGNSDVKAIIDGLAEWCAVLNDGNALHVSFTDSDGNEYFSIDATSASNLVSQMQSKSDDSDNDSGNTNSSNDSSDGDSTSDNSADNTSD